MKKSKSKAKNKAKTKAKKTKTKTAGSKSAIQKVSSKTSNKSGVTPLGERVLVKPITPEESGKTTSFGIIIPDTVSKEKAEQGIVVAVGPGKKTDEGHVVPLSVKPGDKIMFSKYGFDEIKVNGVEYYMLPESSILAILD